MDAEEKIEESRTIKVIIKAENKTDDRGILTFPSENLATDQKIIDMARPTTKRKPLEVSTGIFVKGKKKTGNNTTTKNNEM